MYNLKIEITGKSIETIIDAIEWVKSEFRSGEANGSDENSNTTATFTVDRNDKELFDNEIEDYPDENYLIQETINGDIISEVLRVSDGATFQLYQKTKTGTIAEFKKDEKWGGGLGIIFKEGHSTSINVVVV